MYFKVPLCLQFACVKVSLCLQFTCQSIPFSLQFTWRQSSRCVYCLHGVKVPLCLQLTWFQSPDCVWSLQGIKVPIVLRVYVVSKILLFEVYIPSKFQFTLCQSSECAGWLVECCFTSTEIVGLLGTGAQDGHLDFHTVPELYDTTVQCCFTSTETIRIIRDGSPGRPPRLSHSSWTLPQCAYSLQGVKVLTVLNLHGVHVIKLMPPTKYKYTKR